MFFSYSPPHTSLLLVTLSPHPCLFPSRIPCDSFAGLTLLHGLSIIWLIIQGCCYMAFTLFKDTKLILFGLMFLSRIFAKIILKCYFEIRLEDFVCHSLPCAPGNNFIAFGWSVCFRNQYM